ncbi:pyridoxal-dependent decarboxylase [Candidatus Kapabacteria bacterium]|nr:pyridoxal-dependent decarboxylase [Candidatus Kapabacteria bacterium]
MNLNQIDFVDKVFSKIKNHLKDLEDPNLLVKTHPNPKQLKEIYDLSLSNENSLEELIPFFEKYLDYSVKTSGKQFHNQLFAGYSAPALAAEFVTSTINGSNYTYEVSPLGTLMETELINKMASIVGFEKASGTFLTGGSNANMIAMIVARQNKFPLVKTKGVSSLGELCIFVSEECHYSFEKSANTIGIGIDNVINVRAIDGKMDTIDLENKIIKAISEGKVPFFVGATAGTTERGNFDPVNDIHEICKNYNLWLHIDGAWGGSILLSNKHKHLLGDVSLADSFSWDPHKMMNIPLVCSVILVNDKNLLKETLSSENTGYIFHKHENQEYDLGRTSIQCGKRVDSFKLWAAWKHFGDNGLEQRINKLFDMKNQIIDLINSSEDMEILCDAPSVNINFRFTDSDNLDDFNRKVRDQLMDEGKSQCNICMIDGKLSIRLIVNNPEKDFSDFKIFFDNLRDAKNIIQSKMEDIVKD